MGTPALELHGITKRFGPVTANRSVDATFFRGEIHAVVGENGAGKSTLLQIAAGLIPADEGQIRVRGEVLVRPTPSRAIASGIGMVQQHFALFPPFTVAENVVLGAEPRRGAVVDRRRAEAEVKALADRFGLEVDPGRRVETLSVGELQRVEILKVLYRQAEILILDEPTAVLAPIEVDELFRVLRALATEGRTVVFVTHKLREVLACSDRVTVMRRGEMVATLATGQATLEGLAGKMVGVESGAGLGGEPGPAVTIVAAKATGGESASAGASPSKPALRIEGMRVRGEQGTEAVRGVTLQVYPGEIVGIAGVQGNGQTELLEAVAGLLPYQGRVMLADRPLEGLSAGERLEAGLAHIPEDRHRRGLVLDYSIADNLILGSQRAFSRAGALLRTRIRQHAQAAIDAFGIRPGAPDVPVRNLSGGNQQKVVVARELDRSPRALLAAQPTRGVDIGAMATVHEALRRAKAAGTGILLVSADLTELLALSDRVVVMYRGEIVGELPRAEATEGRLGALMVGGRLEEGGRVAGRNPR